VNIYNHIKNYSEIIIFNFFKVILPKSRPLRGKLLLINTGEIGDLIVSSVILENEEVLQHYSKIYFIIKNQYLGLFDRYVGKIEFIGYNYKKYKYSIIYKYKFLSLLRREGFQTTIQLTAARGILNEEMVHLSGAKERSVINSFWEYLDNHLGRYFDNKYDRIIAKDVMNEYVKHFELIKYLRKDNDKEIIFNKGLTFNEEEFIKKEDYIVIAPFTSLMNRDWKKEYFSVLIKILAQKYDIKLLGSQNQKKDLEKLTSRDKNIQIFAGTVSLNEIPNVIAKSKLFIGLDSGLTHIALKVGAPIVALIGGGEFGRFFPYRESDKVKYLYHKTDCFLCHWECSKSEMFCMTDITPQLLINEVEKILFKI